MQHQRRPRHAQALEDARKTHGMIGVAVAEHDRLNVVQGNVQSLEVVEDVPGVHPRVEEDRPVPVTILRANKGTEAVLGDGPGLVEGVGAKTVPAGNIGARHERVDRVVHDAHDLDGRSLRCVPGTSRSTVPCRSPRPAAPRRRAAGGSYPNMFPQALCAALQNAEGTRPITSTPMALSTREAAMGPLMGSLVANSISGSRKNMYMITLR